MGILDTINVVTIMLIFLRVSATIFSFPIFGDVPVPTQARALLAAAITLALFPIVSTSWAATIEMTTFGIIAAAIKEILVGLMLGFVARLIIEGVAMAASIVGFQMGFGTATLFVADSGQQMDGFTAFHRILLLLFFFALNLHHVFIAALVSSFKIMPAGSFVIGPIIGNELIRVSALVFVVCLQIATPILVSVLFATFALGIIARAVPQMNIFTMSFPVGFYVGLIVYLGTIPLFPGMAGRVGTLIFDSFDKILRSAGA